MQYRNRIADRELEFRLESFGATLIVGPKGCGKTTTAKQKAASVVELQDEDKRDNYLAVAATQPSRLLEGPKPRLFDEWQDAPKLWGAVRKSVDDEQKNGLYILTGSTSQEVDTPHTGTLRISTLKMQPMSLFESGESEGSVSLKALFDDSTSYDGCTSKLSIDELIVDGQKRNPRWAEAILRSYARNLCTLAETKTIYRDVRATTELSESTFYDYLEALEKLYIVEDVLAWCPAIRSKTAIRASRKRNMVDPSVAVAALGLSPAYFNEDFKTLGFLFESLCMRDLKAYSSALGGELSYYRDRYGLEADAVLHLDDGRYALVEFKLGESEIDEGAKHLLEIERLVSERNKKEEQVPLRLPDVKLVITATEYGYRREDGVCVVPIGCLRP